MFDKKGQIVIDKEEYEGDADELQARADAEERDRRFTDQRKLVGKGLAQTLAVPVGEAAGEEDGIRRRVERPELCIVPHGDRSERRELRGERVDVIKRVGKTELSRANDPATVFGRRLVVDEQPPTAVALSETV